jgi:superfamily I DNA/RNA helicase
VEDVPLDALVDHVMRDSGLLEYHKNEKGEKGQARVENLEELVSAAKQFVPPRTASRQRRSSFSTAPRWTLGRRPGR